MENKNGSCEKCENMQVAVNQYFCTYLKHKFFNVRPDNTSKKYCINECPRKMKDN